MEPLASKIRPKSLQDFIGQSDLVGEGKPLCVAVEEKHLFSFILWGPPGTGKTTLARIYAKALNADYHELSAVNAGKDDIRKVLDEGGLFGPKILFLDEIHRFNKAQQDFLLPYVENGTLTLVGATTENPSFEVNPALLSRMRVFVLKEFTEDELGEIVDRTKLPVAPEAKQMLVRLANGDARTMLSIMDSTSRLYGEITVEALEKAVVEKRIRYDRGGEEHYNTISAFIKSMRASQPDAALYYLSRMIEAGEDPKFIARRMVIFASEDVGMEDAHALVLANAVFQAVQSIGLPEAGINLAHGVVYLSLARKSKAAYYGYKEALADVKATGNLPIPLKIRNAPTKLMKDLKYGEGYEKYTKEDLLPEELKGKKYYRPEEYTEELDGESGR